MGTHGREFQFAIWTAIALLGGTNLVGCGGSDASSKSLTAAPPPAERAEALQTCRDSSTKEVVTAFLNAMRDGNSGTAAELLTEQARSETTKHHWPVQPPGAPSATYQIGEPVFVDNTQKTVQIPCLWTEPDADGTQVQFQVTWTMREGQEGWRVAGFSTEIVPGKDPYYFNFEDIAELKATQASAEAALSLTAAAGSAAELAEQPTQRTLR